ncbi:MAG TPA: cytochrome c-type biogenesis protein CcmH [Gemmatimonadales bacterium]|nr:cytochrome c-type biogenesis protein CcmH [Gemmatimonadales bacterium]
MSRSITRRGFLGTAAGALAGAVTRVGASQEPADSLSGREAAGTLRDPSVVQQRAPATPRDNDPTVTAIEKRLRCTCGCNLDIYTCRTTDFSCQTSPALHREVLALRDEGKTPEEIVEAFVARHGEQVLMAPKPEGFNWAGYLVPGTALTIGAVALLLRLSRRRAAVASAAAPPGAPGAGGTSAVIQGIDATPEELERLRRELARSED